MTPHDYQTRVATMTAAYLGPALNGDVDVSHRDRNHIQEHEYQVSLQVVGLRSLDAAGEVVDGLRVSLEQTEETWAVLARTPISWVGRDVRTGRFTRVYRFQLVVLVDYATFGL